MSQGEVNKVLRVLSGKPLKYTVRLLLKDGSERELQADTVPKLEYNLQDRGLFLCGQVVSDDYTSTFPIIKWAEVSMMNCERNPDL